MADGPSQLRHVVVEGRVQGVGFRWFTREKARRLALKGWVRNRADGSVEVAVAGPQHALRQFLAEVAIGPPGANVETVRDLDASVSDAHVGDVKVVDANVADAEQLPSAISLRDLPFPFVIQR